VGSTYSYIKTEYDGPIGWLILNRPDRLNAMNRPMLAELDQAFDALSADDNVRVIIIRGAGRAFCSGYDIQRGSTDVDETGERQTERPDITADYDRLAKTIGRFMKFWDCPKPVIAAVHGYCLAGATQLCVFCDITVVASDARIGMPRIPVGGGYITPVWTPLVGPKRAKQLAFDSASEISGEVASQWGFANYAVPADQLFDDVRDLALRISRTPPEILHMKKVSINRAADVQGWRTIAPMGAETDALLHYSNAVAGLFELVRENGLKNAISIFEGKA
jgi:enoyl-CoA hydratase/carnithine racemase